MMHEFLKLHRQELIERCRIKVSSRGLGLRPRAGSRFGIPVFLDELIRTLDAEQTSQPRLSRQISGPADGHSGAVSEIDDSARQHGNELQLQGFSVDKVVHDYGDLCQAITDMAVELEVPIPTDDFRTLNRCLDNAIAGAVTEFSLRRGSFDCRQSRLANAGLGRRKTSVRGKTTGHSTSVGMQACGSQPLTNCQSAIRDMPCCYTLYFPQREQPRERDRTAGLDRCGHGRGTAVIGHFACRITWCVVWLVVSRRRGRAGVAGAGDGRRCVARPGAG